MHTTLNSSRGVIRCRELSDKSKIETRGELQTQGVAEVIPTNTMFLTFNRPDIPKEIVVGYLKVTVELFVPNLLGCFNCNTFGHTSQTTGQTEEVSDMITTNKPTKCHM